MAEAQAHISIKKRAKQALRSLSELKAQLGCQAVFEVVLPATAQVERCYFFPAAKRAIFEWAKRSLDTRPIVEVGGFLLGQVAQSQGNKFQLVIKQFIAAEEVSFQSNNRLRLGSEAMLSLDDALQGSPQEVLLGWFHTHPGHTPFLSEIDLHSHHALFRAPYHIAVVLDPCQRNFPTIILSKDTSGKMISEWPQADWITWQV